MKKATHKIAVINQNGRVIKTIRRKPISYAGFDSYKYNGSLCPGYWNGSICRDGIEAYIKDYSEEAACL